MTSALLGGASNTEVIDVTGLKVLVWELLPFKVSLQVFFGNENGAEFRLWLWIKCVIILGHLGMFLL